MKYLKENLGFMLVLVLAIIPIGVWFFMLPLSDRFSSFGQTLRSLGQVTGLLGMALLSLNFVLAGRFKFLNALFRNPGGVYAKHHIVGALSFCLLLFHPIFLAVQYLMLSIGLSFNFIFSFGNWALIFGKMALVFMIILMFITFYLRLRYSLFWKSTHKYLSLVLFLGGVHMLLISSDVSSNLVLRYYMLSLAIFGMVSFFKSVILVSFKRQDINQTI